ncbi:MAG: UDP-N-acetylmuramate:L-alanyl-gamma-D-glutamyl-meso-diaminopimelate ligase [Acidobacteria bacterium]|nr:UDP-N-acetylmuramate:L-alanyl-gamma-D-glutamyl-meso-diaminopimelate ligase [Acidobacteriota bacterium]
MTTPARPGSIRRIHLIGICGTGMGSLAGLLSEAGYEVRGSDAAVYPPMSTMLREKGISVLDGFRAEHLDERPDLVVVGNIASRTNPEAVAAADRGIPYLSMPQTIGRLFLQNRHPIVVAGTHGKTSTAALISWVLASAGGDPSFLVGGILRNFNRSYGLGQGREFVIEGDEYETAFFDKGPKFLHYLPQTAILTSIEFDHAEMFADLEAVRRAFRSFVDLIPNDGFLAYCADAPNVAGVVEQARCRLAPYGLGEGAVWRATLRSTGAQGMEFEVTRAGRPYGLFRSPLTGNQNLANAMGVIAVADSRGLSPAAIREAFVTFEGVKRRQEIRGVAGGVTVIDDFAHHPTAVRLTIEGTKAHHPGRRVIAVFEPRTNTTRRNIFQDDYANSFDAADKVIVAAVDHPERAPEGQRLSVERLVQDLQSRGVDALHIPDVPGIVAHLVRSVRPGDAVLIMSNGAFGGIHDRLLEDLAEQTSASTA